MKLIKWLRRVINSHNSMNEALHCNPRQVEPAYIECGNCAAAMHGSEVNLFELGPTGVGDKPIQAFFFFIDCFIFVLTIQDIHNSMHYI